LRRVLFLATGVAMTAVTVFVYQVNLLEKQELQTVDARFELRGSQGAPPGMVLVEVDAATFAALRHNWPFPRSWHARVIDRLRKDGADVIAYGVQFTEASGRTAAEISEDDKLIKAVSRSSGKIVLAATEVDPRNGHTNVLGGDATLRKYGALVGNASFPGGEVIRQEAYEIDRLESFPLVAAEIASRRAIRPSQLGGSSAWIDFRGPPGTIRSVSFSDVFQGKIEPGVFRDKIVVIGPAVPTLPGSQFTPTSANELMSGPELIGNGIWTALHGFPLRSAPRGITLALIVFFGLLAPVVSLRLRLLPMLALALLTIGAYCVSTQLAFERGLILSFVYPLCALVLSTVGAVGVHYTVAAFDRQREAFERERVRGLFGRFVPEQVVDQVLARADGELRLGGVTVEGTIMFTDVRGFTSFSENRPAEQVIEVTNQYLS
jgi:adenylate cyclase